MNTQIEQIPMSSQPNLQTKKSPAHLSSDHDGIAKQAVRTQQLIQASSQLRMMSSSLRGEADQLRAHARVIRNR